MRYGKKKRDAGGATVLPSYAPYYRGLRNTYKEEFELIKREG